MIYLENQVIEMNQFPDGTFSTKLLAPTDESTGKVKKSVTMKWFFRDNSELVSLIFITKHLRASGVKNIDLYMPYIPNARQDRVKNPEDIFTLKYFAQTINEMNFRSVRVLDPHSNVSEALIDRIKIDTPEYMIKLVLDDIAEENEGTGDFKDKDNIVMFYPDEGAMKRYSGKFKNPYAFGIKKRDWKSGKILGLDVTGETSLIPGNDILIVDDICSRGGTFYHSAKKLKELGAGNIYLYVSHCENTILEGEVLTSGLIEKVYTTDSIFTKEHEKVEVFELC